MNQTKFSDLDGGFPSLPEKMTETEFAKLIGVNQSVISRELKRGILTRGAGWRTWVQELHRHSAEVAAGRRGEGKLDLVQERAWLAKAQSEKTAFELKNLKGDLIPSDLAFDLITSAFAISRSRLLSLPRQIKSIVPELSASAFKKITGLIHQFLTDLGHERLPKHIHEAFKNWTKDNSEDSQLKKNQEGKSTAEKWRPYSATETKS